MATASIFTIGVACFIWDFFRQAPVRMSEVVEPEAPRPLAAV
jgi:hypothetical protein